MKALRYVNWLSIDVVLGAFFLSLFFAEEFGLRIQFTDHVCLALAVWSIYTIDHLFDARKPVVSPRRLFHQRHGHALVISVLSAGTLGLMLAFQMPHEHLVNGLVLALICLAYLVFVQLAFVKLPKELLAAVLYALGIFFLPLSYSTHLDVLHLLSILCLVSVAWLNMRIFSWFEWKEDVHDGQRASSRPHSRLPDCLVFGLVSVFLLAGLWWFKASAALLILFMVLAIGTVTLWLARYWLAKDSRYRVLGDALFLSPTVFVWL